MNLFEVSEWSRKEKAPQAADEIDRTHEYGNVNSMNWKFTFSMRAARGPAAAAKPMSERVTPTSDTRRRP